MKFIRIQSNTNINVMDKITAIDMSNTDARVAEQLRVTPAWTKSCVLIREGVGYYPAQMKTWGTVKQLVKKNILTISPELSDEEVSTIDPAMIHEAEEIAKRLDLAKKEYKRRADSAKMKSATAKAPEVGAIVEE